MAGGGGGAYLASIIGLTGWGLATLAVLGAIAAYAFRGLIKFVLIAAIVVAMAFQFFG